VSAVPQPVPTPSVRALGPYSTAVRAGDWVVCAGQVGVDPATGELVGPALADQVRQALANTAAVLADAGCGWEHVAKATLFVATESPQPMAEVNEIYAEVLGEHRPARSTVGVSWLPARALFEIEVWAHKPEGA
jgi:2-iminobutanoate/2-iminopropanoate deaminase